MHSTAILDDYRWRPTFSVWERWELRSRLADPNAERCIRTLVGLCPPDTQPASDDSDRLPPHSPDDTLRWLRRAADAVLPYRIIRAEGVE
ncbi:MAG: hypothetical protein AAGJ54_12630 [Planctomycetota bacterium]